MNKRDKEIKRIEAARYVSGQEELIARLIEYLEIKIKENPENGINKEATNDLLKKTKSLRESYQRGKYCSKSKLERYEKSIKRLEKILEKIKVI